MTTLACFGIGSSRFRSCLGTPEGEVLTDVEVTRTEPDRLAEQIATAAERLAGRAEGPLAAVTVACAGLVDSEAGVVREIDTREGDVVRDVRIAAAVGAAVGVPTFLENDCNAAAMGEYVLGAGREYDCVAHVTMGTGIGAGVVDRGRLLRGEHGEAGEVGLLSLAAGPESPLESLGVPGAWEAYCSGRGIPGFVRHCLAGEDRRRASVLRDREDDLTAEAVFAAAADGDPVAADCVDRLGRYNAAGVGAVANAYNPGIVTLGGGVALYNEARILAGIERHLDDFCYVAEPAVEVTELGGDVGLRGAMARAGLVDAVGE
jgi:glucokinase